MHIIRYHLLQREQANKPGRLIKIDAPRMDNFHFAAEEVKISSVG
jgi:hypothetical protein